MSGINVDEIFKPVVYENLVQIGNNVVANESGYDHLICAGLNPADESFSSYIVQYFGFTTLGASAFDGSISELPSNYPREMVYYKRNVSNIRDDQNVNLEYFINKYNNIFLKMNLNGGEYDWFSTLDVNKLHKFKQIVIRFVNNDSIDFRSRLYAFELLNETHYIVNLVVDGENINVVYLRKDLVSNAVSKLTIEIPEDDGIILNCPPPISRARLSPELELELEVEPEVEVQVEVEVKVEPEVEVEPEVDVDVKVEVEPEVKVEVDVEVKVEVDVEVEPEPEPEVEVQVDVEVEAEPEVELEPEPESNPEVEVEPELEEPVSNELEEELVISKKNKKNKNKK